MDDLLDDVTVLVVFCLITESDYSSGYVSDESYDDVEGEESDKFSIYLCAVWKRSC